MPVTAMRPVHEADLSSVEAVFTDVDGTLTTKGKLTSSTLRAIEWLQAHKVPVVLVSGRPAGWGEAWARQWPVAGAIMENGGLHFAWRGDKLEKVYAQSEKERARTRRELIEHVDAAMAKVKGAQLSGDSPYTEVDLAIDYAEDVALGHAAADQLEAFLRARGVQAVRSSVHVNCWIGDFDKRSAVKRFVKTEWKKTISDDERRYVYVGDSFNDAPMFEAFPLSIGVANVKDVLGSIDTPPKFVTRAREGKGFGEVADAIVKSKRKRKRRS
ncbi:MAG: HAD-IIB family hydrolase [Archangium sp.]|nr:HAD-IIB family hydrolase [Archangium sp.]